MNGPRALAAGCLLCMAFAAPATAADAPAWSVQQESRIGFVAQQGGAPVEGRFESFAAEIRFDPDNLAGSRVAVEIEVASVNSESRDRDQTIRSKDLFDVETWPTARFEADSFTATGDGSYDAQGKLTMRDVTRDVVLPFTLTIEPAPDDPAMLQARALGELSVDRLDYGIGQGQWQDTSVVGNQVIIRIDIRATRPTS